MLMQAQLQPKIARRQTRSHKNFFHVFSTHLGIGFVDAQGERLASGRELQSGQTNVLAENVI